MILGPQITLVTRPGNPGEGASLAASSLSIAGCIPLWAVILSRMRRPGEAQADDAVATTIASLLKVGVTRLTHQTVCLCS